MSPLDCVRAKIATSNPLAVARELKLNRNSLIAVLAGVARPGTVALVEQRAREAGWA